MQCACTLLCMVITTSFVHYSEHIAIHLSNTKHLKEDPKNVIKLTQPSVNAKNSR
jgi:hypothetical protein